MQHITEVNGLQLHNTAVALGKFDGFHKGHQLLLDQVRDWQKQGMTGVIFTFQFGCMNPRDGEAKDAGIRRGKAIDGREEKLHQAECSGIDVLLEYPFTREFADRTPEEFVQQILVEKLHVRAVAIGTDYRFGKNRSGDAQTMCELGERYGFEVKVFDKLTYQGEEISSSSIREAILRGEMEYVTDSLGRGYSIYGEVLHGAGLGHTIGIPTINQRIPEDKLTPPYGVYLAHCLVGGQRLYGIANLGCKPTVSDNGVAGLETYLFNFSGDVYGTMAEVELLHFLRPEKKFGSVDELLAQMKQDIALAQSLIKE